VRQPNLSRNLGLGIGLDLPWGAPVGSPEIRSTGGGFFAVSTRGVPTLYGALLGRFVTGLLTPFLADLLAPRADFSEAAARHGVSGPVLAEALRRLSDLGIF
jgi:hypothetical protein